MRRVLLVLLFWVGCHKSAPRAGLPVEFASSEPPPVAVNVSGDCQQAEADPILSFLGLLPPWDAERPPAMLELGFALELSDDPRCLRAAKRVFFELAMMYPSRQESLRATLEVGALSQHLQEPAKELEMILAPYTNQEARLLAVAKSAPGDKGVAFLRVYGGANADALLIDYTSWLRRGAPPE